MLPINSGDTAWMLASAALVFLMVPGFALFYGGLTPKNASHSFVMRCFAVVCLVSLQWVLMGYSLSFGPDHNGWIGTLAWMGLRGVDAEPNLEYAGTVPQVAFMIYHTMVAVIAAMILLSVFSERIKFRSFCLFTLLWTTFVYDPIAHWVWGVGGFLRSSGVLDFAGGTVVHLSAGASALAMALILGKRRTPPPSISSSQNVSWAALGAGILWLGWFGLNAGNALSAGALAAGAFAATHIAAVAGSLGWSVLDGLLNKEITLLGLITGAITGLVAVTPAAGFVSVGGAAGIGVGAALVCYAAFTFIEKKFGSGGKLFSFVIHGIGAAWGMVAVGLWATKTANPNSVDGLFYGNPAQLLVQIKATVAVALYSLGMTYLLLKIVDYLVGLPISESSRPFQT